eukprot:2732584-Lingulodinium_polyedra.AAC.1
MALQPRDRLRHAQRLAGAVVVPRATELQLVRLRGLEPYHDLVRIQEAARRFPVPAGRDVRAGEDLLQ